MGLPAKRQPLAHVLPAGFHFPPIGYSGHVRSAIPRSGRSEIYGCRNDLVGALESIGERGRALDKPKERVMEMTWETVIDFVASPQLRLDASMLRSVLSSSVFRFLFQVPKLRKWTRLGSLFSVIFRLRVVKRSISAAVPAS